jgi:hypothetical protein
MAGGAKTTFDVHVDVPGLIIPRRYVCSPAQLPIVVSNQPPGTYVITTIIDTTTAKPFVHLVAVNGEPFGVTSRSKVEYYGPCPPPGDKRTHQYRINAYAVRGVLPMFMLPPSAEALLSVVKSSIVAQAELELTLHPA